jgi:CubicO group peptidase (beta-lactamase class C family)
VQLGSVALRAQPDGKGPGTFGWSGGAGTTGFADPARGIRVAGYAQYIPARELPFRDEIV